MTRKITSSYVLQKEIIDLLLLKEYPEESLSFDWQQGINNYNLAIFNPLDKKLLAIFEYQVLKPNPVVITSERARKIFSKYSSLEADLRVPFYIIEAIEGENSFLISKILPQTKNSNSPVILPVKELFDFVTLKKYIHNKYHEEMSDSITLKLIKKIDEIEKLKSNSLWGPEYKLWENITEKLVYDIFGEEGLKLFKQQKSVVLTSEGYIKDLDSRKILLNGLLENREEYELMKKNKKNDDVSPIININNSQVHLGNGDNKGI